MKSLIKVIVIIGLFFASTFVIAKATGFLSIDQIKSWLETLKETSSLLVGITISALLFADLFIAVPTLSLCILSGYFLGFYYGVMFSSIGIILAGLTGYLLSKKYGDNVLNLILKKDEEKIKLVKAFNNHGFMMIILSRALPILPEVTACLSGMTRMKLDKFSFAWLISSIPYIAIASYSGSISSLDNPKPAIFTAMGLSLFFWVSWFLFSRKINFDYN